MKKINLTLFVAILGLLFASCKTDINQPEISANPTGPAQAGLSYSGTFDVNHADSLMTFTWKAADFGFPASITYTLQVSTDNSFKDSTVTNLFTSQKLSGTAKVSDLNTLILSWNYSIGTPVTVYYRVAASVSANVPKIYSSAGSSVITPYDAVINYPMIYVPGAYQGWSPGAENGRLFSYGFNTKYEGIIRIIDGTNAASEFKVTINPNWNGPNYGGTLTKSGNNYSGTLDPNGGNFSVAAGVYAISVDVNALTISLTKTDDWGIIGDAVPVTGWNSSDPMFYNGQRKVWEITLDLNAGAFKFRANDDWALNYGDTGADGTLEAGGDNIAVAAAGNYTIRFDPVKLTYTVKKN